MEGQMCHVHNGASYQCAVLALLSLSVGSLAGASTVHPIIASMIAHRMRGTAQASWELAIYCDRVGRLWHFIPLIGVPATAIAPKDLSARTHIAVWTLKRISALGYCI